VLRLQLGLELVPGREELGLLVVAVRLQLAEVVGVQLGALEDARPGANMIESVSAGIYIRAKLNF
jgi:hypothetical protein